MLKRFMGQWSFVAAVLALTLAAALSAAAQSSAGLSGQILGADGKGLAKAQVTITRTDIPGKYQVKTDKNGKYGYFTLPVGTYSVSVIGPDGKSYDVIKSIRTNYNSMEVANFSFKKMADAQAAAEANMPAPPPGMTPEQAKAYEAKVQAQLAATKKVSQLNDLLKENKTYVDAKQYDQAIAVMEQAVALDQTHDVLFANLAQDYDGAKQYDKAVDAYQKAIALSPNDAGYVINLGNELLKAGKTDEANAAFDKAAKMDPAAANTALYNSAVVLLNSGNTDGAIAAFDKLLAVDPSNANAWYYKGICLLGKATLDKSGKIIPPAGTVEALQKSLQLDPNGANAGNAKAALQTITGGASSVK